MDLQKFMMKVSKLNIGYTSVYNLIYLLIFNISIKLAFLNIKHTDLKKNNLEM